MTTSLTVKTFELHKLLTTALLFASKDDTIPAICAVQVTRIGDELVAVGTDRFRLGVARIPVTGDGDIFVSLARASVSALIPSLKVLAREADTDTTVLSVDGHTVHWGRSTGTTGSLPDQSDTYDFPRWSRLLPDDPGPVAREQASDTPLSVNFACTPKFIADFAKAAWHPGDGMIIEGDPKSPGKPVTIRVGTHFLGIIMPLRTNSLPVDQHETRSSWTDLVAHANADADSRYAAREAS